MSAKHASATRVARRQLQPPLQLLYIGSCLAITTLIGIQNVIPSTRAISIKPADFERFIMPCYLGGGSSGGYQQNLASAQNSYAQLGVGNGQMLANGYPNQASRLNGPNLANQQGSSQLTGSIGGMGNGAGSSGALGGGYQQPNYYGGDTSRQQNNQARDGLSNLGQQVPRANTIDNFIALITKIEVAYPRLASNPDQLIRTLLNRFRLDNYYYDVRARTPISDQDHRADLLPAILNTMNVAQQPQYALVSDSFPEELLDHGEKCSMYFMLSHFIEKSTPLDPPLSSLPVNQLTGPQGGQRPPYLQAAGSAYPGQSANSAFGGAGGASGSRYPGPSPSFGSPATSNMNSFGSGLSNSPEYTGNNAYGVNSLNPNPNQQLFNLNNIRNNGQQYSAGGNPKFPTPYIDAGQSRYRDERMALEYGVVTVGNQENAAIALNRVLMGILAATTPPQTIRQLASFIYPTQALQTNTPKIDEEIDPLYAATLADLWAISSIPKPGKALDTRLLGDNGRWNDTMCPTAFQLERASSIRFTTAELIGGLDGFSLGTLRRRLISMRKNLRLSEMLRMYYSKTGFRPQFSEVSVCNRASAINSQLDDLHRQAENYLRLYQLNLPISDADLSMSITRLEAFKSVSRQAASQFAPPDICQESNYGGDAYPNNMQEQCEIAKADVVTVLDTSPQANEPFMNLVVAKLAQRLGLSRQGNSLSVLTNQQDTTGYAGAYSFNAIVRNSTNTAEIGCALTHDTSRQYQGGQITDPTRLVEMFERALVNLDSEYLIRQTTGASASASSYRQSSYISSLFGQSDNYYQMNGAGPKSTGGAKVVIWFNNGPQPRAASAGSSPTRWDGPNYSDSGSQYKFQEAKKYLRENFRGASILAVSSNRDDVKAFVYDEERDIFTDIPQGTGGNSLTYDYSQQSNDASTRAALAGPADQLTDKLIARMCDIPAVFQYPMCFRAPSENTISVGYISPGRKQYWMMAPKTFFASRSVKMAFKVEGGRIQVCFGRMSKPDESAKKNGQVYSQSGSMILGMNSNNPATSTSSPVNPYYTGSEYGICKDVSPGQEIDFVVDDPCYKRSIAECSPFYYVIRETSNPGEGDPNYMCRDDGCKRFDQVRFTMTHTGVTCSSALKSIKANWFLVMISIIATLAMSNETKRRFKQTILNSAFRGYQLMVILVSVPILLTVQLSQAQQAGVYDYGQNRYGEKRGNFTPSEVLAIIMLIMTILVGLALTIGLCYYVTKRDRKGMTRVDLEER